MKDKVPDIPMNKISTNAESYEQGRLYGLFQAERIIKNMYRVGSYEGEFLIRKDDLLVAITKCSLNLNKESQE